LNLPKNARVSTSPEAFHVLEARLPLAILSGLPRGTLAVEIDEAIDALNTFQ
jgi:hypothetical protein